MSPVCLQCLMGARGIKCCYSFLANSITTLLLRPIRDTVCCWSALKCVLMRRNNKCQITQSSCCFFFVFFNHSMMTWFCIRGVCVSLWDTLLLAYKVYNWIQKQFIALELRFYMILYVWFNVKSAISCWPLCTKAVLAPLPPMVQILNWLAQDTTYS